MAAFWLIWPAWGEPVSLLQVAVFDGARQPLIAARSAGGFVAGLGATNSLPRTGASLFSDRQDGSLFAPYAPRIRGPARPDAGRQASGFMVENQPAYGPLARLRALIGRAEAGAKGYDAVQLGATIRPPKPPTQMTVQEIYDWIDATPGQPHAIGYYQFIPPTLKRLVARLGVSPDTRFSPALQDRLGDILLAEAGLHRMGRGEIDRHAFMYNLGKIWAGLPNPQGLSHYEGIAGNRASISWEYFDQVMAQIFPG